MELGKQSGRKKIVVILKQVSNKNFLQCEAFLNRCLQWTVSTNTDLV